MGGIAGAPQVRTEIPGHSQKDGHAVVRDPQHLSGVPAQTWILPGVSWIELQGTICLPVGGRVQGTLKKTRGARRDRFPGHERAAAGGNRKIANDTSGKYPDDATVGLRFGRICGGLLRCPRAASIGTPACHCSGDLTKSILAP